MHRSMPRLISFLAALAVVLASAHAGVPDSLRRSPTSPSGRGGVWVVRDSTPGVVWKSATYSGGVYGSQVVNLLDIEAVIDVISKGGAQSWQMENRAKTMNAGKFDFGFAVEWMRKDLGIVLDEARSNGAQMPVTALVDQFYAEVEALGGKRWDTSSLIARLK